MIGYYDYTVILTYLSLLSSVGGMSFAYHGRLIPSIMCLLLCGLLDMFDGKVARTKKNRSKEEKSFGIQIDSLSDVIAFGVQPAVIAMSVTKGAWYVCIAAGLYVLTALIRLAYYNVTEEIRQSRTDENRKAYSGLPVTSAALIFPGLFGLVGIHCMCVENFKLLSSIFDGGIFAWILAAFLFITALLFILPFRIRKPRTKELWIYVVLGVVMAAVLLIFALH